MSIPLQEDLVFSTNLKKFIRILKTTILSLSTALLSFGGGFALWTAVDSARKNNEGKLNIAQEQPSKSSPIDQESKIPSGQFTQKKGSARSGAGITLGEFGTQAQTSALFLMIQRLAEVHPEKAAILLEQIEPDELGSEGLWLFVKVLEKFSESDPVTAYQWLQGQKHKLSKEAYEASLTRLSLGFISVDPERSLELLSEISIPDFHEVAQEEFARRWVAHDITAAFNWLSELAEDGTPAERVNAYYLTMMNEFSKKDPSRAALLVGQMEKGEFTEVLVPTVAIDLFEKGEGFEASFDWVKSLADPQARLDGLRALSEHQSNENLPLLVDHLLNEPEPSLGSKQLLTYNLGVLARVDRGAAIAALAAVPDDARFRAAESVALGSLVRDQEATFQWAETLPPGPTLDGVAVALAINEMDRSISSAISWTQRVSDGSQRSLLLRELARYADPSALPELQASLSNVNLLPEQQSLVQQLITERLTSP